MAVSMASMGRLASRFGSGVLGTNGYRGMTKLLCRSISCSSNCLQGTELNETPDFERPSMSLPEYRFVFPEFLPATNMARRHAIREKLERQDMLARRTVIEIPEFYAGSIMAVVASDPFAPGKKNRFVGICIQRGGEGLRAFFILRNVIDQQGVEIKYDMYNPTMISIEVLKLEKRLDDEILYLRDALPQYSTVPFDMEPIPHLEGAPIPVNPIKVKLKPRPWHERWERRELKGLQDLELPQKFYDRAKEVATPWDKYDLMKEYRRVITIDEQEEIFHEVHDHHQQMIELRRKIKRKRAIVRPKKTA